MKNSEFLRILDDLGRCKAAARWIEKSKQKPEVLWNKCKRGDWMLWLVETLCLENRLSYKRLLAISEQKEVSQYYRKWNVIEDLACINDTWSASYLSHLPKKTKNRIEKNLADYLRKKFSWKQIEKYLRTLEKE